MIWFAAHPHVVGLPALRSSAATPRRPARPGSGSGVLLLSAMLVGGALAGLGGFTQLAGVEYKLRPGFLVTYGYIGFLASWLARHHPVQRRRSPPRCSRRSSSAATACSSTPTLPAASVNVLMALVLLGVFGWGAAKKAVAA